METNFDSGRHSFSAKITKMFLHLAHTKMPVYSQARKFVLECYLLTKLFPPEERFSMTQQVRRAALSVHLNLAEGCSRRSITERKRFFEISRGSVIEVDAALDIAADLDYCDAIESQTLGKSMVECFKQLSGLINA